MDLARAIAMAKEINIYTPSKFGDSEIRLIGQDNAWELLAIEIKENDWINAQTQYTYNPVGLVDYSDYVSTDFEFWSNPVDTEDSTLIESVMYACGIFNKSIVYRNRIGQIVGYWLA